jgi:YegS/Rv2252/BmrU family lipid kinase
LIDPLPDPYGSRHLVVLNPAAGQVDTNRAVRALAGAFATRRAGFDILETRGAGDAEEMARMAARAGYRSVVAVGGDGTVGEVITGLAGTGIPLGIIPKGTGNQLACNLGIPASVEAAVDVVVNGRAVPIDLGRLADGRYFAVTAGAGWDAAIMAAATRELKDRWGFGAYLYAGLRTGITPPSTRYHITTDGETLEVSAAMVLVANMGQIASRMRSVAFSIAPGVSFQDGKLDVCIFAPRSLTDVAGMLWRMARRRYAGDSRLIYRQAEDIHIESDSPVITETDGEPIGVTPLSVRAVAGGVNVLVPQGF